MPLPLGHGLGGFLDLPVPAWLFYYGAALVLILSFAALTLLWSEPRLRALGRGRPLAGSVERVVLSPALRVVVGALGFFLLLLVTVAAFVGDSTPTDNLAPVFVYVLFWLGIVAVSVLFGNVWSALNPWRAAADGLAWLGERAGARWETPFAYPERLGRWPAAALLFAFAALELAYFAPANPRSLGLAILVYSTVTWLGMLAFGRRTWLENGEAFNVYFGFLASLSAFVVRTDAGRRRVFVRPPLLCPSVGDPRPGTLAFVAVMLGSVGFDGLSRSSFWTDLRYELIVSVASDSPRLADLVFTLFNLVGLAALVGFVGLAYIAAVRVVEMLSGRRPLLNEFLPSLLPIALAYVVAHYFSYFLVQAQHVVPLASDPLNLGWDLFGSADFRPGLGFLPANAVWYVQVAALVIGHVAALVIAHDRSAELFPSSRRLAAKTQYPMLALMVLYTVGGLWVLSAG
ncbi:MAG: fenitrothion hydrolase [Gaiellaceae bacterium]